MSKRHLARILGWMETEELICCKCGQRISVGDWIHRNNGGVLRKPCILGRGKPESFAQFYHLACFEQLLNDV